MSKNPLISIVVPSYNQGAYIERTILSVLRQDYPAKELIVADGGSTDETLEVLRRYPEVIWFSEPDRGYADGVNKALVRAKGEILGIQSSDDFYAPGAFRAVADAFVAHPNAWLVSGYRVVVDENLRAHRVEGRVGPINFRRFMEKQAAPHQDATFFYREAIHVAGKLNLEADYVADHDFWMRILAHRDGAAISKVLSFYLLHADQRTQAQRKRYSTDFGKAIDMWIGSAHFPFSLESELAWIRACKNLQQASWLVRAEAYTEAASKLHKARTYLPECESWPAFRRVAAQVDLAVTSEARVMPNTLREISRRVWLGRIRPALSRLKWYTSRTNILKLYGVTLPDPRWIYKP